MASPMENAKPACGGGVPQGEYDLGIHVLGLCKSPKDSWKSEACCLVSLTFLLETSPRPHFLHRRYVLQATHATAPTDTFQDVVSQ